MHEMCKAALENNEVLARQINNDLALLHQALFLEANPIPVKWALHEVGLIPEGLRLPMTVLSDQDHLPVRDALAAA
jgi:4-hydroxy-tetrahydrodipicolinate synthase